MSQTHIPIDVTTSDSNSKTVRVAISQRLHSLDALRGLDMLMIIGLDRFFHRLAAANDSRFWDAVADQFTHPAWNGFHLYDLIFPLFLFIAGVS